MHVLSIQCLSYITLFGITYINDSPICWNYFFSDCFEPVQIVGCMHVEYFNSKQILFTSKKTFVVSRIYMTAVDIAVDKILYTYYLFINLRLNYLDLLYLSYVDHEVNVSTLSQTCIQRSLVK